jgi:hypothetical protein
MKKKVVYSLNEKDIQTVAKQELGRKLSVEEIQKVIPFIEDRINWYEVIADSINETLNTVN